MSHLRIVFNKNNCNDLAAHCNHYTQSYSHTTTIYYDAHLAPTVIVSVWAAVCVLKPWRLQVHTPLLLHTAGHFHLAESCNKLHAWMKSKHSERSVSVNLKSSLHTHTHSEIHRETKFALRQNKTANRYLGCAVFMHTPSNCEYKSVLQKL